MQSSQQTLLPNPHESSNIVSNLTFAWTIPFLKKGYTKILELSDIFRPLNCDRSKLLGDRLEKKWEKELNKSKPSLLVALIATFWREYGLLCFISACNDLVAQLGQPLLLGQLLRYFQTGSTTTYQTALMYACGILFFNGLQTVSSNQFLMNGYHNSMRAKVAVCSVIYRKVLRLSQTALGETVSGKVVNLISNDVNRFDMMTLLLNTLWTGPLVTIIVAFLLWWEIGVSGLAGIVVILTVGLFQSYTSKLTSKFRTKTAARTDQCIRLMDEIISGIQVIKMYAWENPFAKILSIARALELKIIRKSSYLRGLFTVFFIFTTRMAVFSTVLAIVLLRGSHEITASRVFMITAYFNCVSLNFSRLFVLGVAEMAEFLVAIRRLQSFLLLDEKVTECITTSSNGYENKIDGIDETKIIAEKEVPLGIAASLTNASAIWKLPKITNEKTKKKSKEIIDSNGKDIRDLQPLTLNEVNVDFQKGKLIGVVGPVGSGKSSILQLILRELPLQSGTIDINGSTSYASQEPWVFAASVRQNILFGENYDGNRYKKVVECCALQRDFEQFENGDLTIVGEKGTLSGGQKARINLARACYRNADIYLLDDPLSAVDAHVGTHIFNKCIGPDGYLAKMNTTRILITHQGKIEIQGKPSDLAESGLDFVQLMGIVEDTEELIEDAIDNIDSTESPLSRKSSLSSNKSNGLSNLNHENNEQKDGGVQMEESSKGKIKGSIAWGYFSSGTHRAFLILLAVIFPVVEIFASGSDYWLSIWIKEERLRALQSNHTLDYQNYKTDNSSNNLLSTDLCMYVQATLLTLMLIFGMTRSFAFFEICMRASQKLYESMFNAIVSTKMRFFDINPSGRILNRFSKDIGTIDELFPRTLFEAIQTILGLIGTITITLTLNPFIVFPILIIGVLFIFVRKIYLKTAKDVRRLEGITKSPAFTHLSATLNGLSTVRAFKAEELLQNEFDNHQDIHSACWFMFISTSSAFGFAMDILCWIFVACNIVFYMFFNANETSEKVGLALTQAISLSGVIQWGVRQSAEVVNMLTSAERILDYCQLEPEKQPDEPKEVLETWPTEGKIEFRNVFYRYFEDAEAVLRNVSFIIKPKEKIGIVGRTGAGKSSTIGAIFRLACIDGQILIDDIDTSTVLLRDLRKRAAIIPQDPVLYSGTLRSNLDPFEEHPDEEVWRALEKVELKDTVSSLGGLSSQILARGANYSVGQRQLLCLARAILRKNRILLMDEATANVDPITDLLIQRTIREKFAECTVLTVAHRLHTIIDSDRVMVMDAGQLVELDKPYNLLQNKSGLFHGMVEALGAVDYNRLSSIALDNHILPVLETK